jgi:hypothetical protein
MIVATDLDRTVIYSRAAAGDDPPPLVCVETYRDAPQSFVTEAAAAIWTELARLGVAVPVTTRTPEQLARVRLPGPAPRHAIASNGGHLLVEGVPDPSWSARVAGFLQDCAPLAAVERHLRATAGPFVTNLRTASDLFAYAVVDRASLPAGWTDALAAWCAPRGWRVSVQGRKVYAVPVPLTKSAAAAEPCGLRATPCSTPTCSSSPTPRSGPRTASSRTPVSPVTTSPSPPPPACARARKCWRGCTPA